MAGKVQKLQRMKARLAGEADASLEIAFELVCECGQSIRGVRRTTSIQKQCEQCGETLFVLPMNVYPATKSVASEVIGGSFADRLKVVVGELLPSRKSKSSKADQSGEKSSKADTVEVAATGEHTEQAVVAPKLRRKLTLPKIDVKAVLRKTFTPFRMVILGIISVVGLTGYWMIQQQAQEAAQQVWLQATDEIESLLQDGKLVELEALLQETVNAGRTLGKTGSEWRRTVNLHQQTTAINRMANVDLLSAFHAAYKDGVLDSFGVQKVVDSSRNGTYIFDSWITKDYQKKHTFDVQMPAAAGRNRVSATIELPQLEQLLQEFPDGQFLFAADIETVRAPVGDIDPDWKIRLSAESFVLLTDALLCQNVGLAADFDPQLASVLERQDEFVRTSKTWEFRADDLSGLPDESTAEDEEGSGAE